MYVCTSNDPTVTVFCLPVCLYVRRFTNINLACIFFFNLCKLHCSYLECTVLGSASFGQPQY